MDNGPPSPREGFRDLRILIAEDNSVNQVVVASLLQALGCGPPEVVDNGRKALTAFRGKRFDIIFMDCHMPDLDGYTATYRIRRMERRLGGERRCYITALTADILPGVEEKCRAAGMDGHLTKPYLVEELIATLDRAREQGGGAVGDSSASRPAKPCTGSGKEIGDGSESGPGGGAGTHAWGDIDIRILDRLRLLGGKESPAVFRDLVRGFLDSVPAKLNAIRDLAQGFQYRPLAFAAHGLKGLALNFGALTMARECEALQLASEGAEPGDLLGILARLSHAEARTRTFLEGMIGTAARDVGTPPAPAWKRRSDG